MINRQAMRGAGTKATTKASARMKLTKEAGAGATVKAKGKISGPDTKPRPGRARSKSSGSPAAGTGNPRRRAPRRDAWRGDEVSPSGATPTAEEAAAWAEGNQPVRAGVAAHDPDQGTHTDRGPARRPRANDPDALENMEEKRQSAAEDHAALPSRHSPHGRL